MSTSRFKESNIEWIGKIPMHWQISKFPYCVNYKEGPGILAVDFREQGVPLLRIRNLKPGFVDLFGCNFLDEKMVNQKWKQFKVVEGDLLISGSASTGFVSVVDMNSAGAIPYTGIFRLTAIKGKIISNYVEQLVLSDAFLEQIRVMMTGSTIQHFGPSHLSEIVVALPPISEQKEISRFLEKKTMEIDFTIQSLESKLSLLEEKRSTLITKAVTKGLNPDVRMKDSRIDWIGEIPEHWKIIPAKWMLSIRSGEMIEGAVNDSSEINHIPVIGGNGVMGYSSKSNVNKPCIAVGRVGALCGNVHLIDYNAWITDNSLIIDQTDGFNLKYFSAFLRSLDLNKLANKNAQPLITGTMVKEQSICKPPIKEQVIIFNYVEKINQISQDLSSSLIKKIKTLKEYQTSLISAAVTGKIDLR